MLFQYLIAAIILASGLCQCAEEVYSLQQQSAAIDENEGHENESLQVPGIDPTASTSAKLPEVSDEETSALRSAPTIEFRSASEFNVKNGCSFGSSPLVKAGGKGDTNDTVAIQNCLYAAGQRFASTCIPRPWNPNQGYPICKPVEVFFPRGTYFVEGVWKTGYPEHSNLNNAGYVDQWVVFTLPRGVAILGQGMEGRNASVITLNKRNDCILDRDRQGATTRANTCSGTRLEKRTGTYLFMAGFEKMKDFCNSAANKNPGSVANLLCAPTVSQAERYASGSQNSFQNIALIGDLPALANHWYKGYLKSQSTAIHINRGRDLRLINVKTDNWYRALNSREGNGVTVTGSKIWNNFKASLYFIMPSALTDPPPTEIDNYNIGYTRAGRLSVVVQSNEVKNTPEFFEYLTKKTSDPFGALAGIYATGNISKAGCNDMTILNNTVQYARIYYEQPCAKVLIEGNRVSLTGMPIQVGSYENNVGLNIAESVSILNNQVSKSVSGILIRGCQYNTMTERCLGTDAEPLISPVIRGNILNSFLPLSGPGQDIWVTRMARSQKSLGGITVADASNVVIDQNQILNLRKGSQSFAIGIEKSRWNTEHAGTVETGTTPDCYRPITRSRNISITRNSISFTGINTNNAGVGLSKDIKDANVGIYAEYSDDLNYLEPGSMTGVEENRLISSTFKSGSSESAFCTTHCRRRLDSASSLMSQNCSPDIGRCVFSIPGLTPPARVPRDVFNLEKLREYYTAICDSRFRTSTDEEMHFPH